MNSRKHQAIQAVARNVEEVLIAAIEKDDHMQAVRALAEMEAQDVEQLEAACRFILGAIEARQ